MNRVFARLTLVLAVGAWSTALATSMWRTDVSELARTSPVVVRGTVAHIQSRWSGDHQRILTDIDIHVSEALKGQPGASVRVTQPGGEVGGVGQAVEGLASFSQGEDVVVFLSPQGAKQYLVAGMSQGKFRVTKAGKGFLLVPERSEAVLLDRTTGNPVTASSTPIRLDALRTLVKNAASKPGAP